jgi:hypothetical protein
MHPGAAAHGDATAGRPDVVTAEAKRWTAALTDCRAADRRLRSTEDKIAFVIIRDDDSIVEKRRSNTCSWPGRMVGLGTPKGSGRGRVGF